MTSSTECPYANLMDPALIANGMPNDLIKQIRDAAPAVKIDDPITGVPFWAVTRKEAIDYVSANNDLFSSALRGAPPMEMPQKQVDQNLSRLFLNMDPPLNLEYRALIRDNFTPAAVAGYGDKLERVAKEVVDRIIDRGECEFVEEVAAEMPLITILEFFEIPAEERKQFFEWTNLMFFGDDPAYQRQVPENANFLVKLIEIVKSKLMKGYKKTRSMKAAVHVILYFRRLAKKWRGREEKNLCTQLLNGTINGEPISDDDFAWIALMLVSAGNESTRTAIAHGMRNLMENPEQYRYLQENPDKIDEAIEEMLRHNTSFITMRRTATQDHCAEELGNAEIKKGDKVVMYYHASNYDERFFGDDAAAFDIHRPSRVKGFRQNNRSFGHGKHNCLGMHLARLEMKTQLSEVLRRMKNPTFAGDVQYIQSNFIQGIHSMPIKFEKV